MGRPTIPLDHALRVAADLEDAEKLAALPRQPFRRWMLKTWPLSSRAKFGIGFGQVNTAREFLYVLRRWVWFGTQGVNQASSQAPYGFLYALWRWVVRNGYVNASLPEVHMTVSIRPLALGGSEPYTLQHHS